MRKIQLYKNTGRGIYIGAIDAITKAYIRKNEVFADAFNYFMYDGAQVIQPERLKELDLILSRLVDTFFSRISPTMQLPPKHHSIAYVLPWAEGLHWQSRSSGCSNS